MLIKFAATVETLIRRSDVFARLGWRGSSLFSVLETNMSAAVEIAEAIQASIANKAWNFDREFNLDM